MATAKKKVVVAPKKAAAKAEKVVRYIVKPKTPLKANTPEVPEGYIYVGMGQEFKVNEKDAKIHFAYITPGSSYERWRFETRSYVQGYNSSMAFAFKADSETVQLNGTPAKQVVNPKRKQPKGGDKVPTGFVCIGQGKDLAGKSITGEWHYRYLNNTSWIRFSGTGPFKPDKYSDYYVAVKKGSALHTASLVYEDGTKVAAKPVKSAFAGLVLHPARCPMPTKLAAKLPAGYVYVGDNFDMAGKSISQFHYAYENDSTWNDHTGSYTPTTGGSKLYFVVKETSAEAKAAYLTKAKAAAYKPLVAADLSLEKQIELATSFAGKHLTVKRDTSVRKFSNYAVVVAGDATLSNYSSNVRNFAASHKKPFVVVNLNGNSYPIFELNEIAPEPIVVNGYTGVEGKDAWVFGCATISKDLLKAAKDFLEASAKVRGGNRTVDSVTIGSGKFTLDILKKLVK